MRARFLVIALSAGLMLAECAPTLAAASHDPIPILGVPKDDPVPTDAVGWGTVRPREIANGGDLSSVIVGIKWSSWGGAKAVGRGVGDYIPHPASSNKGYGEVAVLVALDLGNCQGHWAYRALDVYFPKEGESFVISPSLPICPSF